MRSASMMFALAVSLASFGARADVIEMDFSFERPEVEIDGQGFSHLAVKDCLVLGAPGEPALPVRAASVLLPPDHRVVSVESFVPQWLPLDGIHVVAPAQPPRPLSLPGPYAFREPDPAIYHSLSPFPSTPAREAERNFLRGFAVLGLQLRPVVFHPVEGRLDWAPLLHVRIVTEPDRALSLSERLPSRGLPQDFELVAPLVANPDLLARYPKHATPAKSPDYRYLVITNQALASCSGANTLNTLVQNKQARGIPARLETMEAIRSAYSGADDAAKVRAFILDMYQNHAAEFVLIAGDADGQVVGGETQAPIVPVRNLWGDIGSGADQVPSDLYYGALDGNFNQNGNGVYGEPADQPDLLPEVSVGRAAVDSCTEVANFVRKTLAYQDATASYLRQVHMVGEFLWGDGSQEDHWGKGYLEKIRYSSTADGLNTKGFSENSFFSVGTLYDRDLNPGNPPPQPFREWGKSDIMAVINAPKHIINHLGHSYTNYNMRLVSDDIDGGMSNSQYFFEYSQGCYCGSFDNRLDDQMNKDFYWQDSFAEHMTLGNSGAFAVIMNTRYGLGGYSNYFHRLFWDNLFGNGQNRLGPMNDYSRRQLSGYVAGDDAMRWVYYELTLFGDPELGLHTSSSGGSPEIGLPAEAPWFLAIENVDQPPPQVISVTNLGGGTLNWQASTNQPWLEVSPLSGTAPSEVTLSVRTAGMSEGHYQATVTFTAPGATNSPQQLLIDYYVIKVPSVVAPYNAAAAPTVNGAIAAGEYPGASVIQMGAFSGDATAQLLHNGNTLFLSVEVSGDTDADANDVLMLLADTNGDGLWPVSAADASEGEFDLWAGGDIVYWPYYNAGAGQQTGQGEYASGVLAAFGMNAGHRVAEASFDLAASRLQRSMGQAFRMFLFWLDWNEATQKHELIAMWPFAIRSFDDSRYLATVVVGSQSNSLLVSLQSLQFSAQRNASPTEPIQLMVSATTPTPLSCTFSAGASWLKLNQASGTTPTVVLVSADPAGQSAGLKNTTLTITAPGAANSPLAIPVSFQVDEIPPSIRLQPSALSFEYTQGGAPPAAQTVQLTNAGGGSLSFSATTPDAWIHLSQTSGTAPATVSISPVVQGLVPGYKAGAVTFSAPGAEPVRLDVGIEVRAQPLLIVNPQAVTRSDPLAGGPVTVELEISNQEWGSMDWTISEAASWLTLSKTGGTYITGHPSKVSLTLDPAGLSAGLHQADVIVMAPAARNSPRTIPVAWTLQEGPALVVSPSRLDFTAQVGGANPANQSLNISNGGQGALNYTVTCQPAWLTCSPVAGSAPGTVSVGAAVAGLPQGLHRGTVTIASPEALNSPVSVEATLMLNEDHQNQPPPVPTLVSPPHMGDVYSLRPELTAQVVIDPDGHAVSYTFELYRMGENQPLQTYSNVAGGASLVMIEISEPLAPNAAYEWRVRAIDSLGAASDWTERWMFNVHEPETGGKGCSCGSSGGAGSALYLLGLSLLRRRKR